MTTHTAKSLFTQNIQSAQECLDLYDGLSKLKASYNLDWLLRAAVVFSVSAIDTYFHDKVKYRVGSFSLEDLPTQLGNFEIPIKELTTWEKSKRKGNVFRNWVVEYLSTKPLQSQKSITDALKLAGIEGLWDRIEPNIGHRKALLDKFSAIIKRRNQISHEGDREQARNSGKCLRGIDRAEVEEWVEFLKNLVDRIETAFPR